MLLFIKAARIAKTLLYRMIARTIFSKNLANGRFSHSGSHIGILGPSRYIKYSKPK